jgi:hypothetical protein
VERVAGRALGQTPRRVEFPAGAVDPGRYRIAVAVRAAVNVGPTVVRTSEPIASR